MKQQVNIGVIGGSVCSDESAKAAFSVGQRIAKEGWTLVCGGGAGVMEHACKGASLENGLVVGILPGSCPEEANEYVGIAIPTGIGYARNVFIVRASKYLIAIDGSHGTLSEISFSLAEGKKVIGINTWDIEGVIKVMTPQEAIQTIKGFLKA